MTGSWKPDGYTESVHIIEGVNTDFVTHGPGVGILNVDNTVHWTWLNTNNEHTGIFSDECATITWENDEQWFRSEGKQINTLLLETSSPQKI